MTTVPEPFQQNFSVRSKPPVASSLSDVHNDPPSTDIDSFIKLKSIMKRGTAKNERKDRFGTAIDERRRHKIVFRDNVEGRAVEDINVVESYKDFNLLRESEAKAGCSCALL